MENNKGSWVNADLSVLIQSYSASTQVTVTVQKTSFIRSFSLDKEKTRLYVLSSEVSFVDMAGTGIFNKVITIRANKDISVVSLNYKQYSSDTSVVYPVEDWGTEYYIVTPPNEAPGGVQEFCVFTNEETNTITMYLKGTVMFQGLPYARGSILTVTLMPLQAVQIQALDDLSGTRIVSSKPSGVLTGHSFAIENSRDGDHVYEQLRPTSSWGKTFIVPAVIYQQKSDFVYIAAYKNTRVVVGAGILQNSFDLVAGQVLKHEVTISSPLSITATEGVQVILFYTGTFMYTFDPFFINIPDVASYCTSYYTYGHEKFENYVILVALTSATTGMTLNKAPLIGVIWVPMLGTDYSWGYFRFIRTFGMNLIEGTSPFELLSFGLVTLNGYGSAGICTPGQLYYPLCSSVSCRKKETCQLISGSPVCVPQSQSVCWGSGFAHYHTFDGFNYDFQGTCTYTIAKTCGVDNTLPVFNIEAKNENRGNTRVSYVSFVTIKVYNYIISLIRFEYGQVRVNNDKLSLPVILNDGKLRLYQSGGLILIQTDFTLRVYYDFNSFLKVEISSSFFENICGLCGNYNGNPSDDFMKPSGGLALNPVDFGASWKVEDGDHFCWHDCNGVCKTCSADLVKKFEDQGFCGLITLATGPFRDCHPLIDPKIYMDNCVYDMCMNDGFKQILCDALKTYADTCLRKNVKIYEWRTIAGCPVQCPVNSQFVPCGSGCPATCNDAALPATCSEPCVDSCQCNPGFVLKDGKCIAKNTCGCVFEGRQYSPGQKFWGNDKCTKLCTCNPQTNIVECKDTNCKSTEKCDVVKGIRNCYPLSYGTCTASGDPHCVTFDGVRYNFMGTCVYQLAGLCKKSDDLVDFLVYIKNDNRGSKVVSYASLVEVIVYNFDIIISKEYPNKVMLNGLLINLPYSADNGKLSIYKQGYHCYVQTSFGLLVTYDWQSYVSVKIPSTYAGAVCGLCGDFEGDKSKELTTKDNILTTDATVFGKSWRVRDVPGCSEADKADCPDLPSMEKEQREKKKDCFVLVDPNGPFRECHAVIDPEGAFKDCVYDACFYKGRQDIICQVIASYAAACQDAGIKVYDWRSATFCSPSCGANSHYETCPSGCPTTCYTLTRSVECNANCKEGCVCDEGFVLSGSQCVPISQCGCEYNGIYYKPGEVFYPNGLCSNQCTCMGGGLIVCKAFSCKANEECKIINGILKCQPIGSAQCWAAGDPHCRTFDGLPFDFQGTCTYTLSRTISLINALVAFTISVENEKYGNGKVSVTKMVMVDVYGYNIMLLQNKKGVVRVNGINNNIPLTLKEGQIRVYQQGIRIIVQTDFALVVSYDLVYHVVVTVPGNYKGQLEGLCGNYNGDTKDEFMLPDKTLASDATKFGTGWRVNITGVSCNEGCGGNGNACPVCPDSQMNVFKQVNYCGFLKQAGGPLSACYGIIITDLYYNNCLFDLCAGNGDLNILCHSIQSYVAACQAAGITIQPWRSASFCPLSCPPNSHYSVCADICSTSCAGITNPAPCPTSCMEGCECDDGYVFDGKGCVSMENCGCFKDGKYYNPGEKVVSSDCTVVCTCSAVGGLSCGSLSCTIDEQCIIQDGVRGCVNKDPCKSVRCRTKETCKIKDGNTVCVPDYFGKCWGWGDPHYSIYDGYTYEFQGTCSYTMSKYCGTDPTLVPFTIDEKNDNRGNQAVSYVRLVNIYVYGYKISIYKGEIGKIRINDVIANLPVTLNNGQIQVVQSGGAALLQTDFGLQVSYEWNWYLIITIPSSYYGATCGLCGNFNQIPGDDKQTPDGTTVTSIIDWAKSWQVPDRDPFCFHECKGVCPTCDDSKRALYGSEQFCGIISKIIDGAFRECHVKVKYDSFFDGCLYDVCINGGAKQFLCQALNVYAITCRKEGIIIYDWRTPVGCPLPCGENSHYEACGNACPASCSDRAAPATCTRPCVETCQCNDGYVLNVDKCVLVGSCGCTSNGIYYKPNEEFWLDTNCQVRCKCDPTLGMVVCRNTQCKVTEKCMLVNGVRGCFPVSYSTCTGSGGPHYTTLDGRRYDFMGTCVYQLVGLVSTDPSFTAFTVTVQNDNRGSKTVSYTKVVTLEAYGLTITLSRDFPFKALVNGILTALPAYYQTNKILVFSSGGRATIKTDFDIKITFDWNNYVTVTLPSTYANAVGGLCGNYNQVSSDDLTMMNGGTAASVVDFANSWRIREVPGCTPECTGNCPLCTEAQKQVYASEAYCGIINKANGPFSSCYITISPEPFFINCLFDACVYKGHFTVSCSAIAAYVTACQDAGIQIQEWRTPSLCTPSCPVNMHYELCGNGCPVTCYGLAAPVGCDAPCTEGCFCNNGFILSGDKCVPIAQCGCVYNEQYYKRGQEFYPSSLCKDRCTCGENGVVTCINVLCDANEQCKVVNGIQGCQPISFGKCVASGDPHLISFDNLSFDFQGTCTYILTKLTEEDSRLRAFSVVAENESFGSGNVAVTRMVAVYVYGYTIIIERGIQWKVKVDGEMNNLPLTLNDGTIWINQEGIHIVLQTDFGLTVLYDTVYYVMISVPSTYKGKLGGLCGNFNGNTGDEFQLPDKQITTDVNVFGAEWKVPIFGAMCRDGCGGSCPICGPTQIAPYMALNSCGMITDTNGPFKNCHNTVSPFDYYNHCTYDLCSVGLVGVGDMLCKSLQAYAAACQAAGITIAPWRTATFCPFTCGPRSRYLLCTSTCSLSCALLAGGSTCTKGCFEGCECDDGFFFDGNSCVPMNDCGCVYNGRYLKVNKVIVSNDCSQKCTCRAFGGVLCEELSCGTNELCTVRRGVRGCFPNEGTCTMDPGVQFSSFDGMSAILMSLNGAYEVTSLCDDASTVWFRVVVDFQICSAGAANLAARVHIIFQDKIVMMSASKRAWLNGRKVSFPAQISELLSIDINDIAVVLKFASKITIQFSMSGSVTVSVTPDMANSLCGACGNFNGDKVDDLKLANGNIASAVTDAMISWMAEELTPWVKGTSIAKKKLLIHTTP
ncbi:IgGFc-binding protein-like [Lissotriton helveticus]